MVLVLCLLGMFKTMLSCLTEFESLIGVIKGHLMAVELTKALLDSSHSSKHSVS